MLIIVVLVSEHIYVCKYSVTEDRCLLGCVTVCSLRDV